MHDNGLVGRENAQNRIQEYSETMKYYKRFFHSLRQDTRTGRQVEFSIVWESSTRHIQRHSFSLTNTFEVMSIQHNVGRWRCCLTTQCMNPLFIFLSRANKTKIQNPGKGVSSA